MTNREIFDIVKNHLLAQNSQSLASSGICAYRGVHGAKCAIGCLIPDDIYDPIFEGMGVTDWNLVDDNRPGRPTAFKAVLKQIFADADLQTHFLLRDLQGCHDMWEPEFWAERLAHIENEFFS